MRIVQLPRTTSHNMSKIEYENSWRNNYLDMGSNSVVWRVNTVQNVTNVRHALITCIRNVKHLLVFPFDYDKYAPLPFQNIVYRRQYPPDWYDYNKIYTEDNRRRIRKIIVYNYMPINWKQSVSNAIQTEMSFS